MKNAQGIEGTNLGLRERTIRVPINYTNYRTFVKNQFVKFLNSCQECRVELIVTSNVVLTDQKQTSFSVFFGMDFDDDYRYTLIEPLLLRNPLDFAKVPNFSENKAAQVFENILGEKSGLTVYEVINLIFIFRTLINTKSNPVKNL